MFLSLVRSWLFVQKFSNVDLNAEFQNIRQWWNDHDSGFRSWTRLSTSGSLSIGIKNATAAYTIGSQDSIIFADATSAAFTLTLPSAVGVAGRLIFIKRTNAGKNMVKIVPAGSETIDSGTAYWLAAQYHSIAMTSDGANWMVLF